MNDSVENDHGDIQFFQEFFKDGVATKISYTRLLHVSPLSTSYLVEFENNGTNESKVVIKSYGSERIKFAQEEITSLSQVQEIINENKLAGVCIPKVVLTSPLQDGFATPFIEGEDFGAILRKDSRIWKLSSTNDAVDVVRKLMRWHCEFSESARITKGISVVDNQANDWSHWLQFLRNAKHFSPDWRKRIIEKLEKIEILDRRLHKRAGVYHGDFTPWNVRIGPSGQLWLLDWRRLERGHWLEGAYRFIYALRISGLSPCAKTGFFNDLIQETHGLLDNLIEDDAEVVKEVYCVRAALRNVYYMCSRPPQTLKRWMIHRFWMKELSNVVKKCPIK